MTCEQDPLALSAYMDGELSKGRATEVEEHIRRCTDCATEIAGLASVRRGLIAARSRYLPSADFRRKVQSQIAVQKRSSHFQRLLLPAIAVAMMLILSVGWLHFSTRSDAFSEVADLHVNALASANPVDVVSTDRHTVKPWFQGKIPFSFNVPEFESTEFTLIGGRLVYLAQQPGAQLIVGMRQHKISVLIFQESPELARTFPRSSGVRPLSFNVETWRSHNLRFFVVGDAEPAEIAKLSQVLLQANE
jgi:anti-sigma factor RsiW